MTALVMRADGLRNIYEINVELLLKYEYCKQKWFPNFNDLGLNGTLHDEEDYNEFLQQVDSDKPIILHDNMSVGSIEYIVANLRTSESYGCDNHLYLSYSKVEEFAKLLVDERWKWIIGSGKAVFIFPDVHQEYPMTSAVHEPQMLQVDEIQTIIRRVSWAHGAGGNFFATILDWHPNLLTITPMGLLKFNLLYSEVIAGHTVSEVFETFAKPRNEKEKTAIEINFYEIWNIFPNAKRIDKESFFLYLRHLLGEGQASASRWFKAIFIAYAYSFGRRFKSRIAPAIIYGHEGGVSSVFVKNQAFNETLMKSVYDDFKFSKALMLVRDPVTILAYMYGAVFHYYEKNINKMLFVQPYTLSAFDVRFPNGDERLNAWRVLRFEDLKLYPRETLMEMCNFLCIPWNESLLNCTVQGEILGKFAGTKGFDTAPLYKKHDARYSMFDSMRMELLGPKFDEWGYEWRYNDGVVYDRETILKMFELPFKWELLLPERHDLRKQFHDNMRQVIMDKINEDGTLKDNSKSLGWVKWLRPKLKDGLKPYSRYLAEGGLVVTDEKTDVGMVENNNNYKTDNLIEIVQRRLCSEKKSSFAEIFDAEWMKRKNIYAMHYSAESLDYNFMYPLYRLLDEYNPKAILEFEFDEATKMTVQYSAAFKANHTILVNVDERDRVEHYMKCWRITWDYTSIHGSPLLNAKYNKNFGVVYQSFETVTKNHQYNLILLKCPQRGSIHLDLLTKLPEILCNDFAILMDHVEDECGQMMFHEMMDILHRRNIKCFSKDFYDGGRLVSIIVSDSWKFVSEF